MIVRKFLDSDIEDASKITHAVWGNLYANNSCDLQKFIYDFTLEYYYLNKKFSFVLCQYIQFSNFLIRVILHQ